MVQPDAVFWCYAELYSNSS